MTKPRIHPRAKPRTQAAAKPATEQIIDVEAIEDEEPIDAGTVVDRPSPTVALVPAQVATVASVAENIAKAREFMKDVMKRGLDADYDVIPYCGDKPVLLKPGAEKLARLFNLSHVTDRTIFERKGGELFVGYRTTVYNIHGQAVGDVEAVADSTERTFRNKQGALAVPLNTVMRRAAKRSYVSAIQQATGISDLFSASAADVGDVVTEDQRAVVVELIRAVLPTQADRYQKAAAKVRGDQWENFLGAAVDAVGDARQWSPTIRAKVQHELLNGFVEPDAVAAFIDEVAA